MEYKDAYASIKFDNLLSAPLTSDSHIHSLETAASLFLLICGSATEIWTPPPFR